MRSPNASVAAAAALAVAAMPAWSPVLAHTGPRVWIGSSGSEITTFKADSDLSPTAYTASRVFVGGVDEDTLQTNGRLDEFPVPGTEFFATEFPGYQVRLSGAGFGPSKSFGFELAGPLLAFDSGEQIFKSVRKEYGSPGPAPQMKLAGASSVVTNLSPQLGFNFLPYTSAGSHGHVLTSLLGDGTNDVDGPHAVYAVPMRLTGTGLTRSKPYYVLFGRDIGYLADGPSQQVFLDAVQVAQNTLANESDWPGQWWNNASGNWSDASKWMPDVPDVADLPAQFLSRISSPRTVTVDGNYTVGSLVFNNANRYTLAGTGALTLQMTTGPTAIRVLSGSHTINAPVVLASDAQIDIASAGSTLTMTGNFTGTGKAISKTGAGTVEVKHIRSASLDVTAGKVVVLPSGQSSATSNIGSLAIAGGAKLDLANNKLVTQSPIGSHNGTSYTGVSGLIESGRNGGSWNGSGIITSQADVLSGYTSIAMATAAEIGRTGLLFAGITVSANDVLVMYTYGGDANLSGNVDIDDYGQIDFNASTGGVLTGWYNGDFDYNGVQDIDDYGIIDFVVNIQGAPFSTGSGAPVTAIPEPAFLAAPVLAGFAASRRRRRGVV